MSEKKLDNPQKALDRLESINIQRGYLMNEINEKKQQVYLMESRLKELEKEGSSIYQDIIDAKKLSKQDKKEEVLA